jgi:hypothetical protein
MIKEGLAERTKEIIREDRMDFLREMADEKNTYCFFVSMYEVAHQIHGDSLPPRFRKAEEEWLSWEAGKNGAVPPGKTIDLLIDMSNSLEIKIGKIYGLPIILERFKAIKKQGSGRVLEGKAARYKSHAESQTSEKSAGRLREAAKDGWSAVLAVTFSGKLEGSINRIDTIPVERVQGGTLSLSYPYLVIMLKEDK